MGHRYSREDDFEEFEGVEVGPEDTEEKEDEISALELDSPGDRLIARCASPRSADRGALPAPVAPFDPVFPSTVIPGTPDPYSSIIDVSNLPRLPRVALESELVAQFEKATTQMRKFDDDELAQVMEDCNSWLQEDIPRKKKDPGSFSVPIKIGKMHFDGVLCDSGASINLMPYTVYGRLKLGELTDASTSVQMCDGRRLKLLGIIPDILVKVHDLLFSCDFVVIDIAEDPEMPLILGRPFLATCGAKLDLRQGIMTIRSGKSSASFRSSRPKEMPHCDEVFLGDSFLSGLDEEVASVEKCMVMQDSGGSSVDSSSRPDPIPARKRTRFRIFRKKNAKGVMTVEIGPTRRSGAGNMSTSGKFGMRLSYAEIRGEWSYPPPLHFPPPQED